MLLRKHTLHYTGSEGVDVLSMVLTAQHAYLIPMKKFRIILMTLSSIALVQENMTRMLMVTDVQDIIKRHQAQIITSLKDPDIRLNFMSSMIL